jgi:hypothetical protein
MATRIYGATSLIGGGTGAMDSIDGSILSDQDACLVKTAGTGYYLYHLDETSGAAENSPYVIAPDTNPGALRWILIDGFKWRESGRTAVGLGATTVAVTFSRTLNTANYAVVCNLSNIAEGAGATKYAHVVTIKSTSGFTVEFSDTIDAAESQPYLEWIVEEIL